MVGAHHNLNGSRDIWPHPFHRQFVVHRLGLASYDQSSYQIWALYLHPLGRYEKRYKISKKGRIGVVRVLRGHSRSLKIAPFGTAHMIEFLLAFHSNYVPILRRCSDSEILVENGRSESTPPLLGALDGGDRDGISPIRKLESLGYHLMLFAWSYV